MDYKKSTYVTLLLLTLFSWAYAISISRTTAGGISSAIGPTYFPNILAVLLTILCIISFVQTSRKNENEKVSMNYFGYVLTTIVAIVLFLLSWQFIGYFYINAFIFTAGLFFIYQRKLNIKQIVINVVISSLTVLSIYLLFDVLMVIQF